MAGAEPKRHAADVAYDQIESIIATPQLQPGSTVAEADLVEQTGLGRHPGRGFADGLPGDVHAQGD